MAYGLYEKTHLRGLVQRVRRLLCAWEDYNLGVSGEWLPLPMRYGDVSALLAYIDYLESRTSHHARRIRRLKRVKR